MNENNIKKNINLKKLWIIFGVLLLIILMLVLSFYLCIVIQCKNIDYKSYLSSQSSTKIIKYNNIPNNLINAISANNNNPNFFDGKTSIINTLIDKNYYNVTYSIVWEKDHKIIFDIPSFIDKVKTSYIAKKIEKQYSRGEIIEYYINNILFDKNIYGFGNASQEYFNKSLEDLNLDEITLLVTISSYPNYNLSDKIEDTRLSQNNLLYRMEKYGYISSEERNNIVSNYKTNKLIEYIQGHYMSEESTIGSARPSGYVFYEDGTFVFFHSGYSVYYNDELLKLKGIWEYNNSDLKLTVLEEVRAVNGTSNESNDPLSINGLVLENYEENIKTTNYSIIYDWVRLEDNYGNTYLKSLNQNNLYGLNVDISQLNK